jgi:hypothetical protein
VAAVDVPETSLDALHRVLSYLVVERQRLRSNDAPQVELEANRKAIVAMQMQLARALGRRYGSPLVERNAATFRPSEGSRRESLGRKEAPQDP